MIFGQRSISPVFTRSKNLSRTPTKSPARKSTNKFDNKMQTSYQKQPSKTKESLGIIYMLEEIYSKLAFNEFDAFPKQKVEEAKKKIEKVYKFLRDDDPVCPKHSKKVLSLYSEKEKEPVCVICVHDSRQHDPRAVKSLESMEKVIEYETLRGEQKTQQLIHQLFIIRKEISDLRDEISDNFMNIHNNSIEIINDTIKELETIKSQYSNKLSLAYRRTDTITKKYRQSLQDVIEILESNLKRTSQMNTLSKFMVMKEINKESPLIEELISRFNENKNVMNQWKRCFTQSEKAKTKKELNKSAKEEVYRVTQF